MLRKGAWNRKFESVPDPLSAFRPFIRWCPRLIVAVTQVMTDL
jgi:hypothetical protein